MHRRCKPELRQNFQSASGIRICHWLQIRWTRSREGRAMWLSPALLLLSLSGCFSIRGPVSVRGPEKGSVKVQCHYKRGWETHVKWWCRGARWVSCEILIQTRGSEQEEKKDLVSIKDSHTDCTFTVTMEGLRQNDSNIYWCGIQRLGPDLGTQVQLTVDPEGAASAPASSSVNSSIRVSISTHKRNHYMLLVFVKVPILLILVGAILWLKGSQRVPEEPGDQPIYMNFSELLTKDMAA
ncbi:PREDICTED: CMRF35-like molecule 7 [Mandrillus leucophaeus]|uniref:CMRF35-like molecule 7 n=1 Tax=Mandrillus leucophaeus TaxID=9568 RepID=UPI0005F52A31|nr:PREDICTED: CMRF35-like molecule 7 [Mandrillus leucophaeus]